MTTATKSGALKHTKSFGYDLRDVHVWLYINMVRVIKITQSATSPDPQASVSTLNIYIHA